MKTHHLRRRAALLAAAWACSFSAGNAWAQAPASTSYPDKPVTLLVPWAAGGPVDAVARALGDAMAKASGKTFIVDNRSGANGAIGTGAAARSPADGYVVLVGNADTNTLNPLVSPKLSYKPDDFEPVAMLGRLSGVLVAKAAAPFNTVPELVAAARARPAAVSWGTWGVGSVPHVVMAMFEQQAKVELLNVPYRGAAPAIQDLLGGTLDLFTMTTPMALDQQKSGRVKILGALTSRRLAAAPDVPTLAEQGVPGVVADTYFGIFVPKGTPPTVRSWLNQQVNAALRDEAVLQRFARIGITPEPGTPQQFAQFLSDESKRWGDVIRTRGILNQISE